MQKVEEVDSGIALDFSLLSIFASFDLIAKVFFFTSDKCNIFFIIIKLFKMCVNHLCARNVYTLNSLIARFVAFACFPANSKTVA